jgi:cytoskeleton protein RodZ
VAEFFSPGPGERLRAARLSMGFDLAKIASELHLTSSVVERLEADDYEDIGARVFVRGYLRNYARIVDMPSDSILRQFDEKWPEEPSKGATVRESPRLPADGGAGRGWAGVTTWVVVIGAIALFVMWWQGYLDEVPPPEITAETPGFADDTAAQPPDIVSMGEAPAAGDLSAPDGSLRLPSALPAPAEQVGIAGDPTEASSVSGDGVPSGTASVMLPSAGDPAAESRGEAAGVVPILAPAGPVSADATAADGEDAAAGVPEPTPGVVMTFSAPCWVDVRDSTRKFKLFGEMPKGAREVLGGEPPYQFVVGNARAVTIEVNGEPFDIMPYAKGNVARFTLNP